MYSFSSIFGELRTFFPRKLVACYGFMRFFGDSGCQITLSLLFVYVMLELALILYAFNGQFNNLCRKKNFHQNNLVQKLSFSLFLLSSVALLITYTFIFGSRKEVVLDILSKHEDLQFLIDNNYAIAGIVDSNMNVTILSFVFGSIFYLTFIVHYLYVLFKMLKFVREIKVLGQMSNQKNRHIKKFIHHIINVIIPIIIVYLPVSVFFICVNFFNSEEYYWITKILSNSPLFFIYIYGIFSSCYILYFISNSEIKRKKVIPKKLNSNNITTHRKT
uniref:G-protein coupled receptors family 1 profile domain-containing protein n=1 Tax=Strongyloides venezuelensis TaxID=75913 RepID=A0A0K0FAX9_STRVS